ncbi:Y-family DNA polymerase [Marinobacterium rhizophilum]|uniref:DNA polymerase Y family protein n=1 Tax=Marinobacterium rhizophilum TaxID=420402 RepID=A0ABY5HH18_9GAMM|nr:DNA polymerase Y family protein [Marinobacterium rhizophilum]UTW11122.1 DNA polymerase Y family protein [Marinobacterium rhizophilum]
MNGLWLYLHFPLLPLEMQCTADSRKAAVLLDARATRLELCNAAAQAQGLESGMTVAHALSLVPELHLLQANTQQAAQQLEGLALWSGRFSARVSLQPPCGLLLELESMLRYFRGLGALWENIQAQLQTLELSCISATGHTPLAARVLALDGGFCAAGATEHLQRLQSVPIERLELDARLCAQFRGLGFSRLGELLALPATELAHRFGAGLTAWLERLTGQSPDPPRYFTIPATFLRELPLAYEVERTEALLFGLRRLLVQLEGFLRAHYWRAVRLQLELLQRQGQQRLQLGHAQGAQSAEVWLELCRLRLERTVLARPVVGLRLGVTECRDIESGVEDLFSTARAKDAPAQLLSRLQMRLGKQALYRVMPSEDYRPERSWNRAPLEGPLPVLPVTAGLRPLWLLNAPERLPPDAVGCTVELLQGPERIVSGWWDQQPVRRDYYIGRWVDGRRGWLYREPDGGWYLHGWFG